MNLITVVRIGPRFAFEVDGTVVLPSYATYAEAQAAALDEARCLDSALGPRRYALGS